MAVGAVWLRLHPATGTRNEELGLGRACSHFPSNLLDELVYHVRHKLAGELHPQVFRYFGGVQVDALGNPQQVRVAGPLVRDSHPFDSAHSLHDAGLVVFFPACRLICPVGWNYVHHLVLLSILSHSTTGTVPWSDTGKRKGGFFSEMDSALVLADEF